LSAPLYLVLQAWKLHLRVEPAINVMPKKRNSDFDSIEDRLVVKGLIGV